MSGKTFMENRIVQGIKYRLGKTERDLLVMGITFTALLMFVRTGGSVLSQIVDKITGIGVGPNQLLTNALLLNIALVIFGWRRHDDLCAEIRERRQAETQARLLAETDALTGCLNRRSISPNTDNLIEQARQRGEIAAFVMIDVDNFKQINDVHSHAVGDRILEETAARIKALVPEGGLVARLGGDEFACVVAFDPRHPERIDNLAAHIIERIAKRFEIDGFNGDVTISVGVTRGDKPNRQGTGPADAATLLHMADIAMYQAKKQGRNRYMWFEDTMETELRYRSELETGIRQGIAKGEFVPYYEQQVDIASGQIVGFEMLARWESPAFGLVNPEVFIPIAEEIGVIAELSECLIAQAMIDAREWDPKLTLAVNISPIQLRDPWFAQKLLRILVSANFPPNRLDIEITETCLHQNISGVHALVTSLKNQGIGISLDDFGTGYSSLAQLSTLPFDRIKIDRSFVTNINENGDSLTIVETITKLGAGLGLPITAEGIETREVLEKLQTMGPFKGQGYLYGRPQPAAKTRALLAECNLLQNKGAPEPKQPDLGLANLRQQA